MKTSPILVQILGAASLIAVCAAAYPNGNCSGGTSGWTSSERQLRLLQIFHQFTQDMYAAGLDDHRKQLLRTIQLQGLVTDDSTADRLFNYFEQSWLDIEREIDQAKRVLLCQKSVLKASPSAKTVIVELQKDLQRVFYEKHMVLHTAALHERYQFDLESVLWQFGDRSAVPRVFAKARSRIEPPQEVSAEVTRRTLADKSLTNFCSTPWEFEFILPQKDGSVKRYRIEL